MQHRNHAVGGRPRSIRSNARRSSRVPLVTVALVLTIGGVLSAIPVLAAAPNVREVTPAGITIDGSRADWDDSSADFLANMFEAGKPDHPVLAKLYGRYDCASRTFYVHVTTITAWVVIPSDADNYVKQGQTDKLVDGDDGTGPPPAFAYISKDGWEASFAFAPGTYTGEAGLNVHALVAPEERASTAAVADRRLDVTIVCPEPTPTPTASPTPEPTPTTSPTAEPTASASTEPTALPSESASVEPSALPSESASTEPSALPSESASAAPSESASAAPSESASALPSESASALPSESASGSPSALPSGSAAPSGDPPLIVIKVADQGTPSIDDDEVVGGARFELRLDDGDEAYEPDGDDAPLLASVDAPRGFAVFEPTTPGDYWVTEVTAPTGLATMPAVLVTYTGSDEECGWYRGDLVCRPDEDGTGGFVLVAFKDPPTGSVEAQTGGSNLPETDTAPATPEPSASPGVPVGAIFALSLAVVALVLRRRHPDHAA